MDHTQEFTHISICAGYGGIDLGLKRAIPTLRTIAVCEIEAFAIANLVAKMEAGLMDPAPIWSNLKTFPWGAFRDRVDILSGGYPCQPFSAAGKRGGKDDPRHLWPFIQGAIVILRPRYCFFENVEGHLTLGFKDVCHDLDGMGYEHTAGIFSASECGAPQQRKRMFILARSRELAHSECPRTARLERECRELEQSTKSTRDKIYFSGINAWPSRPGQPQYPWEPARVVANSMQPGSPSERGSRGEQGGPSESSEELGYAECPERRPLDMREPGQTEQDSSDASPSSEGEVMGDSTMSRCGGTENAGANRSHEGEDGSGSKEPERASERELVNPANAGQQERRSGQMGEAGGEKPQPKRPDGASNSSECKVESEMGGNLDGLAGGVDYAELCESSDNRTDELRLLGNGVVPETARTAFVTLLEELNHGT